MLEKNPAEARKFCFAVSDREMLLHKDGSCLDFSELAALSERFKNEDFFADKEFDIAAVSVPSPVPEELLDEYKVLTLREYFAGQGEEAAFPAFRARAILTWRKNNCFCAFCGKPLMDHEKLSARVCSDCGKVYFPRIEPCVIVAVKKDDKILLARHTYRNQDIYACIAGFMEAGESAEAAVEREVEEETGLKIKNIKYRGSQSWPFPDQLMLGFTADWASGDIQLQKEEISDAQWFDPENCPASPKPGSIAYRLIHGLY